jgi:hypothetical protein
MIRSLAGSKLTRTPYLGSLNVQAVLWAADCAANRNPLSKTRGSFSNSRAILTAPVPAADPTGDEALAHARLIVDATDLPVFTDLEKGFADAPEVVAETIRLAAEVDSLNALSRMRLATRPPGTRRRGSTAG